MRQGTSPRHVFILPFDPSSAAAIQITYKQGSEIVLQKQKEDCNIEASNVSVSLTQEETFLFDSHYPVLIQIRILTKNGEALASDIIRASVEMCLDREVLL